MSGIVIFHIKKNTKKYAIIKIVKILNNSFAYILWKEKSL